LLGALELAVFREPAKQFCSLLAIRIRIRHEGCSLTRVPIVTMFTHKRCSHTR
jgi:hypothetical protein